MPRRLPLFLAFSGYISDYYERFVVADNTLCKYAVHGGCSFRGRGALFIVGKAEYKRLSDHFGIDFVTAPHRVSELPYAILSAGWQWHDFKLNVLADVENIEGLARVLAISKTNRLIEFWGRAVSCMH
jgi:predicted chitinase